MYLYLLFSETTSCFGGNKKKKDPQKIEQRNRSDSGYQRCVVCNVAALLFSFHTLTPPPPNIVSPDS